MVELFLGGGYSMFLVLVFGALAFATACIFAWRPEERRVGILRALSAATAFSVAAGVTANIAAVMSKVPRNEEWAHSPDVHLIVMTGIGESMAPAILGFTLLSLAWLVTAVGVRRMAIAAS